MEIQVPAKIRFFLRLMVRKSILTRDNLLKRGWKGDKHCMFCGKDETIDHLFFSCSVAKIIWALVRCVFDLKCTPRDLNDCLGIWLKISRKIARNLYWLAFQCCCGQFGDVEITLCLIDK